MKPTPYKHLKTLRLWKAAAEDAGVAAVAEVLRNGKAELALTMLEFMDAGVTPGGCAALGDALMLGANASLQVLRLDMNMGIGDDGVRELCKGLRTNRTLQKLTLSYCGVGPAGAAALADVIASPLSALVHLDVMGNSLGAEGLLSLAIAAQRSKTLKELVLRDNGIGGGTVISYIAAHGGAGGGGAARAAALAAAGGAGAMSSVGVVLSGAGAGAPDALESMATVDVALSEAAATAASATKVALEELGRAMADPAVPLASVNLELNSITADEAAVLVPFMKDNTKMQVLTIDTTLPADIFSVLCRTGVSAKGKKKVVKKKKK